MQLAIYRSQLTSIKNNRNCQTTWQGARNSFRQFERLSLKQGTGNRGMGMGNGNGEWESAGNDRGICGE